jgi:hypothetical protein
MTFPEENNLEVWKTIPGFEDYSVSTWGRVRRDSPGQGTYPGRIMNACKGGRGYLLIRLSVNAKQSSIRLHRLIAMTFLPNPDNLPEVDHLDYNKENNRVENLIWATKLENVGRSWKDGNHTPRKGTLNGQSKLTEKEVFEIKVLLKQGVLTAVQISEIYKCDHTTIGNIKKGRAWAHVILPTES